MDALTGLLENVYAFIQKMIEILKNFFGALTGKDDEGEETE